MSNSEFYSNSSPPQRLPEEVFWIDSAQLENGAWMDTGDVLKYADDLTQRSVGYVLAQTDDALILARSVSDWSVDESSEKAEGVLCIPLVCVLSRQKLEPSISDLPAVGAKGSSVSPESELQG